ncbi:MAG: DUF1579 domain-containing protein [Planctomycetota bacterium]|jgi:hypothetical protein
MRGVRIAGTAILVLGLALVGQAALQDGGADEMQKKWMEYMLPGKVHQEMAGMVGKWKIESEFWMDPALPPEKGTSTSTIESTLGGRYFIERMQGMMMGMPTEGMGVSGYDNARKIYHATWFDTWGTGVTQMDGTRKGDTITYAGNTTDAAQGASVPMRMVMKTIDDDHFTLEMFMKGPDGQEFRNMKLSYARETAQ